jgi:MoaA/NifB/PqqE/SkfB family radical SAM enzyme
MMSSQNTAVGLTRTLLRIASARGPGALQVLWRTRRLQAGLARSRRRRARVFKQEGLHVPMGIAISPTARCNLACEGCYSRRHPTDGEMPVETIDALLGEATALGVFLFVITGGEPYLRPEMIDLYERHRNVLFLTVTNGTLIDAAVASRLAGGGNLLPVVSIEGTRERTDDRRGEGVYDRAIECMRHLAGARIPFGFSTVVTRGSTVPLGSEEFIGEMVGRGCIVGFFNEFIPVGSDREAGAPDGDGRGLVPDAGERDRFTGRLERLRRRFPIVLLNLPADEYDADGRCMSVSSGAVHVNARGDVEPCPFAHYALENVARCSFRDILSSPFLSAVRSHPTALRRGEIGCALVNNRDTLRAIAEETGARPTHGRLPDCGG